MVTPKRALEKFLKIFKNLKIQSFMLNRAQHLQLVCLEDFFGQEEAIYTAEDLLYGQE